MLFSCDHAWKGGSINSRTVNFGSRQQWVVKDKPREFPQIQPQHLLNTTLNGPQSPGGRSGKGKEICPWK